MEFDMTKVVEKITMQVEENQEEFIFETIYPYCENILQMKINKEELKQILLNSKRKQQPCEDCISREQTLKAFAEKCGGECACCEYNGSGYDNAENCKLIKSMPSVTPSRPRGKWIYSKYHTWICSVCGENTLKYTGVVPSEEKMKKRWRYCSICGAEMEGEE